MGHQRDGRQFNLLSQSQRGLTWNKRGTSKPVCFHSFREEQTLGRDGYQAPGWTVGPVAWTQFRGGGEKGEERVPAKPASPTGTLVCYTFLKVR